MEDDTQRKQLTPEQLRERDAKILGITNKFIDTNDGDLTPITDAIAHLAIFCLSPEKTLDDLPRETLSQFYWMHSFFSQIRDAVKP